MYIVKKADEDLLCEKGDEICNAVHNVIIAVAKKTDIDSAIQEAIDSLALHGIPCIPGRQNPHYSVCSKTSERYAVRKWRTRMGYALYW